MNMTKHREFSIALRYLRPKEVCEYMSIGLTSLHRLAKDGKLTKIKLSPKMTMFDREEIDKFMADSCVK